MQEKTVWLGSFCDVPQTITKAKVTTFRASAMLS